MEKPEEPRPEDFGLSEDRLFRFKEPFGEWLYMTIAITLTVLCTAIGAVYIYDSTRSVLTTAAGLLFVFSFSALAAGLAAVLVSSIVLAIPEAIWRTSQPDYPAFKSYEKARAEYGQQLDNWLRLQESWWQSLSGDSFEYALMRLLRERGYNVVQTGMSGDSGVDLVLKKDSRTIIIQCKAHKNPIGPGAVRDLYGTLMHRKDSEAWLVSTSGFSRGARDFASEKPVRLLTIQEILRGDPR
ncbi:MAG: restriction endonuclease [Candidatus Binatia bacterium]